MVEDPGVRSFGGPSDDRIAVEGQGGGIGGVSSGAWGRAGDDLIVLQACCGGRAVGPLSAATAMTSSRRRMERPTSSAADRVRTGSD
jgi:hypothetical protein